MGKIIPLQERFDEKWIAEPSCGCWLWIGAVGSDGYGQMGISGKTVGAHRVAWTLHRGQIPAGLFVNHKCHTPCCVNPDHLYVGTAKENTHDAVLLGRMHLRAGDAHPRLNAKINRSIAMEIYKAKGRQREIADRFGVCASAVSQIKSKISWKCIHRGFV